MAATDLVTNLAPVLLAEAAARYGVTPAQLQPLAGGHYAAVFAYTDGGRPCVMRILPPGTGTDQRAIRAVMEWLAFATAHNAPVPHVIRSRAGQVMEVVGAAGREYVVHAFARAPGTLAEGVRPEDWDDDLFAALGRTIGHYHRIAQDYAPAEPALSCPEWDAGASCFNPIDDLAGAEPIILTRREQALAQIRTLPKDRDCYGLAHLDLHFGNFYVDVARQQITLLDFDDCAYGWYLMDIAMLLFDVLVVYGGADRQPFGARFLTQLLRGYGSQMPISAFWVSQLPHVLKLLEIGVYLMLYRDYDPAVGDGWVSRFMPGRRERIVEGVPYVALDFAAVYASAAPNGT